MSINPTGTVDFLFIRKKSPDCQLIIGMDLNVFLMNKKGLFLKSMDKHDKDRFCF